MSYRSYRVHEEVVGVGQLHCRAPTVDGQVKMFREAALSLADAARTRDRMTEKIARVVEIINRSENKDDHFLLWHDLEAEREALCKAILDVRLWARRMIGKPTG